MSEEVRLTDDECEALKKCVVHEFEGKTFPRGKYADDLESVFNKL